MSKLLTYILLDKKVGETPLECVEAWRQKEPAYTGVPLAYAGRLDPMASGALLILIGDECKVQEKYHALDKTYRFSVLFGAHSDSGDVLGLISQAGAKMVSEEEINTKLQSFIGPIELPYPVFSARTVQGKPLHTWAMEGRLNEIEIPTKKSTIFNLKLEKLLLASRLEVHEEATQKIALLPQVTDPRKALGNDFRRPDVLSTWQTFRAAGADTDQFSIGSFICTASSGTYMRTLAEEIAKAVGSTGLAFSIHREAIGRYNAMENNWEKIFT